MACSFRTGIVALSLLVASCGTDPRALTADGEVLRLQAHFDTVDGELRAASMTLSPAQRATRNQLIGWLREYRHGATFPRNDRFSHRVPIFRDSRGVLCAMAYLVARSGRADIVDRIARNRNYAYIPELASDRELIAWLQESGLTVAEAARVQPSYAPPPRPRGSGRDTDPLYAVGSGVLIGHSLIATHLNAKSPTRKSAWTGLAAGAGAVVLGAVNLDDADTETKNWARANVLAGAASLIMGTYRLSTGTAPSAVSVLPMPVAGRSGSVPVGVFIQTTF